MFRSLDSLSQFLDEYSPYNSFHQMLSLYNSAVSFLVKSDSDLINVGFQNHSTIFSKSSNEIELSLKLSQSNFFKSLFFFPHDII
jgi:hypothetical protein